MIPHDRSVPYKRPFVSALLFICAHYLSLVAVAAAAFLVVLREDDFAVHLLAGAAGLAGVTWLVAFLKRRGTRCPLCKGTPFLDSGALTHRRAFRLFPLNYGTTAILSCIFFQRFRCMYCGNRYDLLKPSPRARALERSHRH
jgi:hypothetical protein